MEILHHIKKNSCQIMNSIVIAILFETWLVWSRTIGQRLILTKRTTMARCRSYHLIYPLGPGSHSSRYLCKLVKWVFLSFVFALIASAVYDSDGRPPWDYRSNVNIRLQDRTKEKMRISDYRIAQDRTGLDRTQRLTSGFMWLRYMFLKSYN